MSRKNIFTIHQDYEKKPDRNTFDLSFANNLTLKFGALTPVFCKECVPGDSFRIKPSCALQFMPMAFPVQTPMRAYLHFFKTRNRTMWKDWMDFISGTKSNLVHPYVHPSDKKKFYRVGGLADYLGVPNTLYSSETTSENIVQYVSGGSTSVVVPLSDESTETFNLTYSGPNFVDYAFLHYFTYTQWNHLCVNNPSTSEQTAFQAFVSNANAQIYGTTASSTFKQFNPNVLPNPYNAVISYNQGAPASQYIRDFNTIPWCQYARLDNANQSADLVVNFKVYYSLSFTTLPFKRLPVIIVKRNSQNVITSVTGSLVPITSTRSTGPVTTNNDSIFDCEFTVSNYWSDSSPITEIYSIMPLAGEDNTNSIYSHFVPNSAITLSTGIADVSTSVVSIGDLDSTPYDSEIRLNAFPFRAYECIYNAYYRNSVNDPFKPDGVTPEYNKFNTTYEGGADTTQYDLYYRNWEYDFLTSAVPTPQFGNAPLVGLTSTGAATLEDGNGNRFIVQAQLDSDGEITGWTTSKENDPSGSLRMLMNMATTGISINDLRNVNAYQRFLENAIRKGLSYRDQILAHYGVSVRYDELDMPEFIGGCSTFVDMNKINQLSEGGSTPLGSFVGQATAMMSGKHDITEYCDEHGFIIGILSIVPMPVYSQLLPKHFIHAEQLDYYFPEFKHVGYQPIAQKEVSPLQTYYSGGDLNKTFGYNRAYYDLIASTDEVHGQFRTTMRDFIMNRTFENEPVLGGDFLHVDPDQLNDVFLAGDLESSDGSNIYAADADKIIGSLYFDVQKKSPISLYGIAKLE